MKCLLMAAGSSQRFGSPISKVFSLLRGKALLRWSLEALEASPLVQEIILVADSNDPHLAPQLVGITKLGRVVEGGASRALSVAAGLAAIDVNKQTKQNQQTLLLIHDAARPGINENDIARLAATLKDSDAAAATFFVPINDNCTWRDGDELSAKDAIKRQGLGAVQTPQLFRLPELRDALAAWDKKSAKKPINDETEALRACGKKVVTVDGSQRLHKVTWQEDLDFLHKFVEQESASGLGFDVHAFVGKQDKAQQKRDLVLGGVKIKHDRGLAGHSDADVLLHAVIDAILGAAAMGDIGMHFPDTDARWRDIDSRDLLEQVMEKIAQQGWRVAGIDCTLIGEEPKISHYSSEIKDSLAHLCGLTSAKINVKATTTEGLGFCGRREGLAAMALANLLR